MTELDAFLREVTEGRELIFRRIEEGETATREELERIAKGLQEAQNVMAEVRRDRLARIDDGRLRVPGGRLAGFDMFDLAILHKVFQDRATQKGLASSPILETIVQARQELKSYVTPESLLRWEDGAISKREAALVGRVNPGILEGFRGSVGSWREAMVAQVCKAMDSTTAGAGDELVPTIEAAQLWMDVNLDTLILPLLPQISMPSNPFDMPAQLGDTNWYPITENLQALTTDLTTAKVTLTAKGLKTGVPFSDELEDLRLLS